MLSVGFGLRKITPRAGAEIPGLFERRVSTGVADDLYVRATVVQSSSLAAAFVQVDAIAVPESVVQAVRQRLAAEFPDPAQALMVAATHTHSGGPVAGIFNSSQDPRYLASLERAIVGAIRAARRRPVPCILGVSKAQAPGVAFNRRFYMKDGTQVTHPGKGNKDIDRVAGPADDTVSVVAFAHPVSLKPLGVLVSFACHTTHMNGLAFSADYPRHVIDTVQAVHGAHFPVVFLNAPCGDVTQLDNLSMRPHEFGPYWCARTGRAVGAAALQALATMDYSPRAGIASLGATVRATIRSSSAAELALARDLAATGDTENAEVLYARERLAVEEMRRRGPKAALEVLAIRLGEALLWSVPGELFQQFALDVRGESPFSHTFGVTLANGYYGYICTPEAFQGGGYETRLARSSFLAPDTGGRIAGAAVRLARALHRAAAGELRELPGRRVWPSQQDNALDGIRALEKNRRQP